MGYQVNCSAHDTEGDEAAACAQSNRLGYEVSFSEAGGVEIEENWDKVKRVTLDTEQPASSNALAPLLSTLPLELRAKMEAFIQACYEVGWPRTGPPKPWTCQSRQPVPVTHERGLPYTTAGTHLAQLQQAAVVSRPPDRQDFRPGNLAVLTDCGEYPAIRPSGAHLQRSIQWASGRRQGQCRPSRVQRTAGQARVRVGAAQEEWTLLGMICSPTKAGVVLGACRFGQGGVSGWALHRCSWTWTGR